MADETKGKEEVPEKEDEPTVDELVEQVKQSPNSTGVVKASERLIEKSKEKRKSKDK